jgi:adenylosuccinate synthase
MPGWDEDLSGIQTFEELPISTKNYIAAVEKIVGVPVTCVGVGPKRSQAVFRD